MKPRSNVPAVVAAFAPEVRRLVVLGILSTATGCVPQDRTGSATRVLVPDLVGCAIAHPTHADGGAGTRDVEPFRTLYLAHRWIDGRLDRSVDGFRAPPQGSSVASYFDTVRLRVDKHWEPDAIRRSSDRQRAWADSANRLTVLRLTLDRSGRVEELCMTRGSGVEFLDREAISAMREGMPLPPPPDALQDADGLFRFKVGFDYKAHASTVGRGVPFAESLKPREDAGARDAVRGM